MGYRTTCFDRDAGFAESRGETPTLVAVDRITVRATHDGAEVYWQTDFTMKAPLRRAEPAMKPLFDRLRRKATDSLRAKLG